MDRTGLGDQSASTPMWRRVVAIALAVLVFAIALILMKPYFSLIGSFDAGMLEAVLVGMPILAVVQGLMAWIIGNRSRHRSLIRHRGRMLAEVGAGVVICAAPAVWLPLHTQSVLVRDVTATHATLFMIAFCGLLVAHIAAMAHVWWPLSRIAAQTRDQYRHQA